MNNPMMFNGPEWMGFAGPTFWLLMIWSLVWKGLALWHAGRKGDPIWFVVFLLVNLLGILEIFYLFFVLKLKVNQLFRK